MNILNQKYDKVVCINLVNRKDKKEFMQERFNKLGIEVEWFHPVIYGFNGIINKALGTFNQSNPNEVGPLLSHYHVIKTALEEGINNLFVFEDDCAFHKDWNELLPKYLDKIPNDADGIMLYSYMSHLLPENIRVNSRWTKGFKSWSLIAYSMNRRAMQEWINRADKCPTIADKISYEMMESGFNFYIASPPLVLPAKELSSNIRINKNYETTKTVFVLGIDESNYN